MPGNPNWKPGVSGNPSGRPKDRDRVRELAKVYTKEAIETLVTIMRDPTARDTARVSAAEAILNRGWGKPEQAIELGAQDGDRIEILWHHADARTRQPDPPPGPTDSH